MIETFEKFHFGRGKPEQSKQQKKRESDTVFKS